MKRMIAFFITIVLIHSAFFINRPLMAEEPKEEQKIGFIGGGLPKGNFFNPTYLNVEQHRLYVADTGNNRVQAFVRGNIFQIAFGGFGQNEREFEHVGGICSNGSNVYVVDSGNSRIQIFDNEANFLGQFGTYGSGIGNFKFPTDIAIHSDRLFVLDSGNHRIQICDFSGHTISSFGTKGSGFGEFRFPLGVEVAEGKLIVSDTGNNRVQIFDLQGVYEASFGYFGSEEKAMNQPKGVFFDDGVLYVIDSGNKRVKGYALNGNLLFSIKLDTSKSPYGVAVFDTKILVSDKELNTVFSYEKDGRLSGYFGSSSSSNGFFVKPISIAVSENSVFVLDAMQKTIQVFNEKNTLLKVFSPIEIEKASLISPIAITYFDHFLYVLDATTSMIHIFTEDGKFIESMGKFGSGQGEFIFPFDIALYGPYIFIADSGNSRIQILNRKGLWVRSIGEYGSKDGQFTAIKGITVQDNRIFAVDSGNHRIQVFDFEGNFVAKYGRKGLEIGNYNGSSGIYSDASMKLYIADTFNHRIQILDTLTNQSHVYGQYRSLFQFDPKHPNDSNYARGKNDYSYALYPGSFSFPMDVVSFHDNLIVADTFNLRCQNIPFATIFPYDTITIMPSFIDLGSVSPDSVVERKFLIHNESGSMLEGKISSDNPSITVYPTSFFSLNQEIIIKAVGTNLEKGKMYTSKLSIIFKTGAIKVVDIVLKAESTPDFYILMDPLYVASGDDKDFKIPIKVIPQNGFSGLVTFTALSVPKNTTTLFDPSYANLEENDTVYLKFRPSNRFVEAGIYNIEIEGRSGSGMVHKSSSIFIYKQELALVMHTVLGELFTSVWCINCVFSHYAIDRLSQEMGTEKIAWIEYYVDSTDDLKTVRLAYIESEQRMKWYMTDNGIPQIFFDGTDSLKGVPLLDDDSYQAKRKAMYDNYKKKIVENSKQPSLVSLTARTKYDSNNKTASISASVIALDNIPFKDPRIYFALTESSIPYGAINGDKIHHFVLRDFISPLNNNEKDYLGIPLKLPSGVVFGKKGDAVQVEVNFKLLDIYNISNVSLIAFVQDNVTKKVIQTQVYPVKVINLRNFEITSDGSLNQKRTKGEEAILTSYIINSGSLADSFDVSVINKTKEKWNYQVFVDGQEKGLTGSDIILAPGDNAKIEIKVYVPGNAEIDSNQEFQLQVTSLSNQQTKSFFGTVDVIDFRAPDFLINAVRIGEDTKVLAGNTVNYKILVDPNPIFQESVSLSIKGSVPEIASLEFKPDNGKAPYESVLSITIKPEVETKDLTIIIQASSVSLHKTVSILIPILTNPDAIEPDLDISFPPDHYLTNKEMIEVSGMVDTSVEIFINDKSADKESNGRFSAMIKLKEGQNKIHLQAKNRKGLTTDVIRMVTLDSSPPNLTVEPIEPEVTKDMVVITGKTEPGTVVSLTTYKTATDVPVDQNGKFSFSLKLEKGYNTIEVAAVDSATNSTSISIDVRYITLIQLRIGSKMMRINEEEKTIDAEPYIKNGRTMVPLRAIAEALGIIPNWNESLKEITLTRYGKTVRIRIGSKEAYTKEDGQIGESIIVLEAPPEIVKGRTFVPLRFVVEALGSEIKKYDATLKEITIID